MVVMFFFSPNALMEVLVELILDLFRKKSFLTAISTDSTEKLKNKNYSLRMHEI